MFPFLIRGLNLSRNSIFNPETNTNDMSIEPDFTVTETAPEVVTNIITNITGDIIRTTNTNVIIDFITSIMADSNNGFIKILYNIIMDNPYAVFLFIVISVFILTIILRFVIYIFPQSTKYPRKHIVKRFFNTLLSSNFVAIGLLLGTIIGVEALNIHQEASEIIKSIALSILLWMLYNIIRNLITLYARALLIFGSKGSRVKYFKNRNMLIVVARMVHVLWIVAFVTILLGIWGVEIGPIIAGLGVVGIIVGIALQDSLAHIIGGMSLMLDETYSEGDFVILENGKQGTIFNIGYRSTRIRTLDEEIIIVPNGILAKMIIINQSQPVNRCRINLYYKTYAVDATPERVKELLLKAAKSTPNILRYPEPYVYFTAPEGILYTFRLCVFSNSPIKKLTAADSVQREVVKMFNAHNVRFGMEASIFYSDEPDGKPVLVKKQ